MSRKSHAVPPEFFRTLHRALGLLFIVASICVVSATTVVAQYRVPDDSGRIWVPIREIPVDNGTLIQISASGRVNAGGTLGEFGPEGTTRFPPTSGFPVDSPHLYGLVLRMTSSRDSPHDELRNDYAYGDPQNRSICFGGPGFLWLTINDNNPADNTGQFDVRITRGSCAPTDTSVRRTRIHVTDNSGANVEAANVYVDEALRGLTDRDGNVDLPPVAVGARIIARKRVWENPTPRNNHRAGSTQNWNYRVYNTSLAVNDDATLSAFVVVNPLGVQEVPISTMNTLIGLHLVASVEWDASLTELQAIRDSNIIPASQSLYNATDGQFFIEQLEILDNAALWDDADIRIYTNWSLRANVNYRGGFFGNCVACGNAWMNMSRTNWFYVYAHEFAHYGFDLGDEYADDGPIACTANVTSTTSPFGWWDTNRQGGASCMMWNTAPKFCSAHSLNPHVRGTRQGDEDCWSHLIEKYRDRDGASIRWLLKSPTTRGTIVGMLPTIPVDDWRTHVGIDNSSRLNLCEPIELVVTSVDDGHPLGDREVYNRTSYGQVILEGKSRTDDPATTSINETGFITATGVHVGDQLTAGGGPSFTITGCPLAASVGGSWGNQLAAHARPNPSLTSFLGNRNSAIPQTQVRRLSVGSDPFELYVSMEPDDQAGRALVRVRASTELSSPPEVELTPSGTTKSKTILMRFDNATNSYVGHVDQLPISLQATIRATAVTASKQSVTRVQSVTLTPIIPKNESDVFSADGQLSVTIPPDGLPAGARISVGASDVPPPSLPKGVVVVSGPFKVASTQPMLNKRGVVRFHLPDRPGQKPGDGANGAEGHDPNSFEIHRYNSATKKWESVGGRLLPAVAIVTVMVNELGTFVLTARPLAPAALPQQANQPVPSKLIATAEMWSASPEKHQGSCPVTIKFSGKVRLNGKGRVKYAFVRSDGATGPEEYLEFEAGETKTVSTSWTLGGPGLPTYEGWQVLRILSPNVLESEKASFWVQCKN